MRRAEGVERRGSSVVGRVSSAWRRALEDYYGNWN